MRSTSGGCPPAAAGACLAAATLARSLATAPPPLRSAAFSICRCIEGYHLRALRRADVGGRRTHAGGGDAGGGAPHSAVMGRLPTPTAMNAPRVAYLATTKAPTTVVACAPSSPSLPRYSVNLALTEKAVGGSAAPSPSWPIFH